MKLKEKGINDINKIAIKSIPIIDDRVTILEKILLRKENKNNQVINQQHFPTFGTIMKNFGHDSTTVMLEGSIDGERTDVRDIENSYINERDKKNKIERSEEKERKTTKAEVVERRRIEKEGEKEKEEREESMEAKDFLFAALQKIKDLKISNLESQVKS